MTQKLDTNVKCRGWVFTINNYTDNDIQILYNLRDYGKPKWMIVGKEVGESGTPHLQGAVYFDNARSFSSIKKWMPKGHLEKMKGSCMDSKIYCSKDNDLLFEFGNAPNQGKRNDLVKVKEDIVNGKRVDDICMENPELYHQYGRTLNMIEDIAMRKNIRNFMTNGIWLWGPTGIGKSHIVYENYSPETHYVLNVNDNGWWDSYRQQPIVIINEFRGQIKYGELLDLCDKWPKTVKRRNREPMPFMSTLIYITSSMRPEDCYSGIADSDSMDQLYRRFEVLEGTRSDTDTEVLWGNTKPRAKDFEI